MRLDDALERFALQLHANGRSPLTIAQYRRHIEQLGRWLSTSRAIETIRPDDLAAFLAAPETNATRDGRVKKATSMNALRATFRAFFGYLNRAGHLDRDPSRLIQKARCTPAPPRSLSDDERVRLLDVLRESEGLEASRDFGLFHVLIATGIRLGSALALESGDVDLERGELTLRTTKGNAPTRVVLGIAIREHLRLFLDGRASGPLFVGRNDRPITARHAERRFKHWLECAGIERDLSPHALRHTFAMQLYERTRDLLLVREGLKHRSVASTMVYARLDTTELREALAG